MSQGTLERDIAPEAERPGGNGLGRALLRVVILSVVVTALVAGVYLLVNGRGENADPLATQEIAAGAPAPTGKGAKDGKVGKDDKAAGDDAGAPAPAEPTFAEAVRAAAADLPKNADAGERRKELINFAEDVVGMKIGAKQSPATAADLSCTALDDGTSPKRLIEGFVQGNEYTFEQNKAFLLGATTLYCPTQAKDFR